MIYDLYHFFYFFGGSQKQKKNDMITGKGDYTGMEKKKHGSKMGGASCMFHEPNMERSCMEGYLYVGKPASNEEERLVGDPTGCTGDVEGGGLMIKCRSGFSSQGLGASSLFFSLKSNLNFIQMKR